MPSPVLAGARLRCSQGLGESRLCVSSRGVAHEGKSELATIDDYLPLVNIPPFVACRSQSNPYAANPSGNKPCTPRCAQPWSDEIDFVKLRDKPLLEQQATLACDYAGTISIVAPSQQEISMDDNMRKKPLPKAPL